MLYSLLSIGHIYFLLGRWHFKTETENMLNLRSSGKLKGIPTGGLEVNVKMTARIPRFTHTSVYNCKTLKQLRNPWVGQSPSS